MGMKTSASFLLLCFAFAAEAQFEAATSDILATDPVYARKLNDFLSKVIENVGQWKPCYDTRTDGWESKIFHRNCDHKPNTVTIIKVGNSVFGGFTDVPWDISNTYGETRRAFIFSMKNREQLGPFMSMVKTPKYAIYKDSFFGPTFGRGYDIQIENRADSHSYSYTEFGNAYEVPSGVLDRRTVLAGSYNFSPDAVEVFYLE